jgi:galactokinase
MTIKEVADAFHQEFSAKPKLFSAPGRVNLIGEHTDYNEGFVLPSAIGFYVRVAVAPRPDRKLVLRSTAYEEKLEFDLASLPSQKVYSWCDYILGVATMLRRAGHTLTGANLLVHGEVPMGAGLSSSAALEVASALALLSIASKPLPLEMVARLCQRAENEFVGARVGIMDPFISCFGRNGHAVLLDCRSLDFQFVPIPAGVSLVISNTKVKHELSSGEYNRRREECEQAVRVLSKPYPRIHSLRDISAEQLAAVGNTMPEVLYRRALHVVTENDRVIRAASGFGLGDLHAVGNLMRDSHRSLRDNYEVSCRELDVMVEAAEGLPGYYGGRMTGGGFGGCTVNLVDANRAQEFREKIAERYQQVTHIIPDIYVCSAANGAALESEGAIIAGSWTAHSVAKGRPQSRSKHFPKLK